MRKHASSALFSQQSSRLSKRVGIMGVLLTAISFLGVANSAVAADAIQDFPAGSACTFDLRAEITGTSKVSRSFNDKNGNPVWTLTAGKGTQLTLINLSTGASLALRANGSVVRAALSPDGSSTVNMMGHNILIMFPTDIPAGPTTTLYVGQVTYTSDSSGTFTLGSNSGKKVDICAALSS